MVAYLLLFTVCVCAYLRLNRPQTCSFIKQLGLTTSVWHRPQSPYPHVTLALWPLAADLWTDKRWTLPFQAVINLLAAPRWSSHALRLPPVSSSHNSSTASVAWGLSDQVKVCCCHAHTQIKGSLKFKSRRVTLTPVVRFSFFAD